MQPIIEIHHQGAWHPAAMLTVLGTERCRVDYLPSYIFSNAPERIALDLPVAFQSHRADHEETEGRGPSQRNVPAFLYDLVPQGRGRQYLLRLLEQGDRDDLVMPLLLAGAFNPIGRLRISTAVAFYEEELRKNPDRNTASGIGGDDGGSEGFDIGSIVDKAESFLEHLALRAMLSAGTTGVQGVAPKFLLTQDANDQWFADMALPDHRARKHWIVKMPRGRSEDDLLVHRHEAAYLRLAAALGLRTHGEPVLRGRMLFTKRFDRLCSADGVTRLHQESLASLAGLRGFGAPATQNQLLAALRKHATDPLGETLEFLKRDVFNMALRNTDNHARNTAVQVTQDGHVQLTPVFDVSPMFLDPEMIPRSVHWRDEQGRRLNEWEAVFEHLALPSDEQSEVINGLKVFSDQLERLPSAAQDHGVEPRVLEACRASIDNQIEQLQRLPATEAQPDQAHRVGGGQANA